MSSQKTVLVTGGAGFIGSHLCERLVKDGYRVISLDNYFAGSRENHVSGVEYREGHTKDIEAHVPESPEVVYHLGEYSRVEKSFEDVEQVWDLNKLGTFAVLEFCRRRGSKIVYAGSSTKFGDGGLGRDQSPYAWAKATNTELVKNYSTWFGVRYAIAYFYNVYGPRERAGAYGTVIEIFRQNYSAGDPLTVVSPGTQKRNFTYVGDVVEGLVLIGERGEGDNYGLGDDRVYSVREVADMFGGEVVMLPERQGNRMDSSIDTSKTQALGWSVQHTLKEYVDRVTQGVVPRRRKELRVLVFTTTFHPFMGRAERALERLMEKMPEVHFDIVTTFHSREAHNASYGLPNVTVHPVGVGRNFDKYLLAFLGSRKGHELAEKHEYLFVWSLMASYGTLPAIAVRRTDKVPLLVTLADQRLSWYEKLFLRFVVRSADQVHASLPEQGAKIASLQDRMRSGRSLGEGDAFANQIRFSYGALLARLSV